jgi:hypothetical protein
VKHHKLRHEARYQAALKRITPAHEAAVRARVALENCPKDQVEWLVAHKLGKRSPKRFTPEIV